MGARLFEELKSLRELNEREELQNAKRDLEETGRRRDLLIKEIDHRGKNSLQIGAAADQFIVNELVNNAIQHSRPSRGRGGRVRILLKTTPDSFLIRVSDRDDGPSAERVAGISESDGIGAQLIDAFARQIRATITKDRAPDGYAAVTVSRAVDQR